MRRPGNGSDASQRHRRAAVTGFHGRKGLVAAPKGSAAQREMLSERGVVSEMGHTSANSWRCARQMRLPSLASHLDPSGQVRAGVAC